MKKKRFNKKDSAVRLYATTAIVLIAVFQFYWLYSVYNDQKSLVIKECENTLQAQILKKEVGSITGSNSKDTNDVGNQIANALESYKGEEVKVKVSYEGNAVSDELSKQILGELVNRNSDPKEAVKSLYKAIQKDLKKSFPNLKFSILASGSDNKLVYPTNSPQTGNHKTEKISSDMGTGKYYQLYFQNLEKVVIFKMFPSIILSLIYLLVCVSAVIFLVKNIDKRKKLMEMKDDFTHNMTHEFKTPLATLYAATEALTTYNILDDKEMSKEYIGLMRNDLNRLSRMVESILNNAKLKDGKMVMEFENVNLKALVENITSDLKPQLSMKKAIISIKDIPDSIFINVDKEHFTNVVCNLIDNSLKYGSDKPEIYIKATKDEKATHIIFSDNGIGIDSKYKNQIFSSYYRVPEGDQYKVKGYGLGLSYVKDVVSLHGGSIELIPSKNNLGATFEIILPL